MKGTDFYSKYFNIKKPFKHQLLMWNMFKKMFEKRDSSPILLKAPTGSGKTEAILAPFLAQFLNKQFIVPRLVWVLPTRALINQLTDRIKKYAEKVSDRIKVAAQHGENQEAPWFFADIVVTTLDQLIYGYARMKQVWSTKEEEGDTYRGHVELSCGDLAHSLLVFDEAHMYSPYTWGLMHALFEILHTSGVPFILSTATMPDSLKKGFEGGVLGSGFKFKKVGRYFSDLPQRTVEVEFITDNILKCGELNPLVWEGLKTAKRALVVVNRVKRAQKVYELIKENLKDRSVLLIHSRFTVKDRKKLEEEVENILGKEGRGGIVVSTQVLEAGLDISADLLISELAPADSLVQRSGRCARWGNKEKGKMLIFESSDADSLVQRSGRCARWGEEKGKMLIFESSEIGEDEDEASALPYRKEDLDKTREKIKDYVMSGKTLDLGDWNVVKNFIKDMNYKPDHIASAQSACVLLEKSVLFADSKPRLEELSVREDSFVTIYFADEEMSKKISVKGEKTKEPVLPKPELSLTLPVRIVNDKILKKERAKVYRLEKELERGDEVKQVEPYQSYWMLSSDIYDNELGLKI